MRTAKRYCRPIPKGIPNYHSEALGCPIRLRQPDNPLVKHDWLGLQAPRLQWFDSSVTRWRDVRTDTEHQLQVVEAQRARAKAKLDQVEAQRDQAKAEQLEASIGTMRVLLADSKPQAARRVEEFWRRHGVPAGHLVAELVKDVATGAAPVEALLRAVPDDAGKGLPDADHLPHEDTGGNDP